MQIVVGIDIGNATTEVALAKVNNNNIEFLSSAIVPTTGIKGTKSNINGVFQSLMKAVDGAGIKIEDIDIIRLNEAAPVIGDVAMETITETIITESTMIGHNPKTPGGEGIAVGMTVLLEDIKNHSVNDDYIVIISREIEFDTAAKLINEYQKTHNIVGAIVQKDDGVLINNRLDKKMPIIDEVSYIDKIPLGMLSALEVAPVGKVIESLSNPYGIATYFGLSSEDTKKIVPIARALIGNRSAVVIKTPKGNVKERIIPAGNIIFSGKKTATVPVEAGAEDIMKAALSANPITDVRGEAGSNVGGMLERVRLIMAQLTDSNPDIVKIKDLLAVDTFVPQKVSGGLANEFSYENAVGIAAMVKADKLQMNMIADKLSERLGVEVVVGGVEADMAIRGALTTPGTNKPLAILDMGAGSTDASIITKDNDIVSIHLAGAGNMVTMLIDKELGLGSNDIAEDIKKYPLARVESLYHIRHEDGTVEFFTEQLSTDVFSKTIILKDGEMIPIDIDVSIEKVKLIRKNAKEKVFVTNAIRALSMVSPTGNIRDIEFVVLVGGSALDFEIPQLVTDALSHYNIVAGRGNIRGELGPRNAVATGLVMSYRE